MKEMERWKQNTNPRLTSSFSKRVDGLIQSSKMWTSEWGECMNAACAELFQEQKFFDWALLEREKIRQGNASSSSNDVQFRGSVANVMARSRPY